MSKRDIRLLVLSNEHVLIVTVTGENDNEITCNDVTYLTQDAQTGQSMIMHYTLAYQVKPRTEFKINKNSVVCTIVESGMNEVLVENYMQHITGISIAKPKILLQE